MHWLQHFGGVFPVAPTLTSLSAACVALSPCSKWIHGPQLEWGHRGYDTTPTRSGSFTALLPQQRTRGQCLCRSVGDSAGEVMPVQDFNERPRKHRPCRQGLNSSHLPSCPSGSEQPSQSPLKECGLSPYQAPLAPGSWSHCLCCQARLSLWQPCSQAALLNAQGQH